MVSPVLSTSCPNPRAVPQEGADKETKRMETAAHTAALLRNARFAVLQLLLKIRIGFIMPSLLHKTRQGEQRRKTPSHKGFIVSRPKQSLGPRLHSARCKSPAFYILQPCSFIVWHRSCPESTTCPSCPRDGHPYISIGDYTFPFLARMCTRRNGDHPAPAPLVVRLLSRLPREHPCSLRARVGLSRVAHAGGWKGGGRSPRESDGCVADPDLSRILRRWPATGRDHSSGPHVNGLGLRRSHRNRDPDADTPSAEVAAAYALNLF